MNRKTSPGSDDFSHLESGGVIPPRVIIRDDQKLLLYWVRPLQGTPPPMRQYWRQHFAVATAPFAPPRDKKADGPEPPPEVALGYMRLNPHTGLVRLLQGELYTPPEGLTNLTAIAAAFVRDLAIPLNLSVAPYPEIEGGISVVGTVVQIRQRVGGGIPVYGGTMTLGFNQANQINLVNNSWYPLPQDYQLPFEKVTWEGACEIAWGFLLSHSDAMFRQPRFPGAVPTKWLRRSDGWPSEDARPEFIPARGTQQGKVIFPVITARGTGRYHPAYVVWINEWINEQKSHRAWEVVVAADSGKVLACTEAVRHTKVFLTNADVISNPSDVSLGATDFQITCSRTLDPAAAVSPCDNVAYHLAQALTFFQGVVADLPALNVQLPGDSQVCQVCVSAASTTGSYRPSDRSLSFGTGMSAHGNCPPIQDPALDCEVIYHEYAHAVTDVIQPDLFKFTLPYLFKDAISEGVAFYFACACSLSSSPPATGAGWWGEYAYHDWQQWRLLERPTDQQRPGHDYLTTRGVFPSYPSGQGDPAGACYACGMVWARTLWDVRRVLGGEVADAVILRSLALLGGVQSDLETAAELLIQAGRDYAAGNGLPEESYTKALRLIFYSRGIAADVAIHDLVAVQSPNCIIVATDGRTPGPAAGGCLISTDGGSSWAVLGQGGPAEGVALAVSPLGTNPRLLWLATETWDAQQHPVSKVYQYTLVDNTGALQLNNSWTELPPVPSEAGGILCLAAASQSGVFVGTENGLYRYEAGSCWSPLLSGRKVFDLIFRGPIVRIATDRGIYRWSGTSGTMAEAPTEKFDCTLALCDLWVGTAEAGLYNDLASKKLWPGGGGPIYSLLKTSVNGNPMLYIGTHRGVYQYPIGTGKPQWAHCSPPELDHALITALAESDGDLWVATADDGLWRRDGTGTHSWERRLAILPPRSGLVDVEVPSVNASSYSASLSTSLDMQVIYIPEAWATLSLQGITPTALYYVAPFIDPANGRPAGLQTLTINNNGIHNVAAGFYLLVADHESFSNPSLTLQRQV